MSWDAQGFAKTKRVSGSLTVDMMGQTMEMPYEADLWLNAAGTVGGVAATWDEGVNASGSAASRVDTTESANQLWIKFDFDPIAAGFDQPGMEGPHEVTITFPGGGGTERVYTTTSPYTYMP